VDNKLAVGADRVNLFDTAVAGTDTGSADEEGEIVGHGDLIIYY